MVALMWIQVLDACFLSLALHLARRFFSRKRLPLPPGPPGWPLIGNLLDMSSEAPHKLWGSMSRKYGPMMSLNLMGARYLVLNSPEVAKDLLEKHSAITSNRPHLTMCCDLVGLGDHTGFLQYGDKFRKHRTFFRQHIGTKKSLEAFYPSEEAEAKRFLRNIVESPDSWIAHCYRIAGAAIMKISHGYTVTEGDDPLLKLANEAAKTISMIVMPGQFLVDIFPILRYWPEWLPGGGFHKDARRWRNLQTEAATRPFQFVLDHVAKGDAEPSFVSRALQEGVTPEEEDMLKWTSLSLFLGGSDTTPCALSAFFPAMTMFPDVLKKAQAEVDAVIGNDRLPTCQDRDALPYINAVCLELLRWHVVLPLTLHVSTEDIIHEGYLIPKGTSILGNIWFMLSNPETYPNPDVFDPERFLGENRQLDPRKACFGWGRRSCPGDLLAELTIFTCVAMVVATLDVSRYVENGVECVPKLDVTEVHVRRIKPFKCKIVPRSKRAEDLLQA